MNNGIQETGRETHGVGKTGRLKKKSWHTAVFWEAIRVFVAPSLYSLFYAAYHPADSMEERRAAGLVSPATWELWRLFCEKISLSTSDIRRGLGATSKKGSGPADRATRELQRHYYITLSGRTHKMDKYGKPYGWAINLFERVAHWVPAEWLDDLNSWRQPEACEALLEKGMAIGRNVCRIELAKVLGLTYSRVPDMIRKRLETGER